MMASITENIIMSNYSEVVTSATTDKELQQPFSLIALADTTIVYDMRKVTGVTVTLTSGTQFPVAITKLVSTTGDVLIGF